MQLYEHQIKALKKMHNGCILCGGTGSGKSITAIAYYYQLYGGDLNDIRRTQLPPLYIITTARKRDTQEWVLELNNFGLNPSKEYSIHENRVVIDSWNNIKRYTDVSMAFFIFDEQRVVGSGAWVKAFLNITRKNKWILLSATPGDTWKDYIPVFVANGFYKNKTDFANRHIIYSHFTTYPMIQGYRDTGLLMKHRNDILVPMNFERFTIQHHENRWCSYPKNLYSQVQKDRWNVYEDRPIVNAAELCYTLRKVVNSDPDRITQLIDILDAHPKAIIFYNFDYELLTLRDICDRLNYSVAEWNGHLHQPIPKTNKWVYLVQYTAGAEGWNCIDTDTIIFYSQTYSYKTLAQAEGRIDRLNTPFEHLYYFHLKSRSSIDLSISNCLKNKKDFSEAGFAMKY